MKDYAFRVAEWICQDWIKRVGAIMKLEQGIPRLQGYLKPLLRAIRSGDKQEIQAWGEGAPRPKQRERVLAEPGYGYSLLLFGSQSGTGKTTTAFEKLLMSHVDHEETGEVWFDEDEPLPIALTGAQFAARVAANAKDLDRLLEDYNEVNYLFLDDLDKRRGKEGFTDIVSQVLFDVIENRTMASQKATIITLNSDGRTLRELLPDYIGDYLIRRLKERFTSINFDVKNPKIIPLNQQ